jgi:flagellar biosynthesis protein FliQ
MSSWGVTEIVLRAVREGLLLVLLVSAPPLLASMLVGLVVGAFQAASQIHDPAVAFVPKLVAAIAVLLVLGPVLGAQVLRFTQALLLAIATLHS